jgi:hypothetical protein
MNKELKCSIHVNTGATETYLRWKILKWSKFHVLFTVGHPRLQQLSERAVREAKAGNIAQSHKWSGDRERLIQLLTGYAAAQGCQRMLVHRKIVESVLTLFFASSTLLCLFELIPMAGVMIIDGGLILALLKVAVDFEDRIGYLADLMELGLSRHEGFAAKMVARNAAP